MGNAECSNHMHVGKPLVVQDKAEDRKRRG